MRPNPHYTQARRIRKNRQGVYVTHAARKLRRHRTYRDVLTRTAEVGRDVLWGGLFFIGLWVVVITVVVGGLVLIG